jgi:hypothetical protein
VCVVSSGEAFGWGPNMIVVKGYVCCVWYALCVVVSWGRGTRGGIRTWVWEMGVV